MDELQKMERTTDGAKVELNSGLGEAIQYMLKRWQTNPVPLVPGRFPDNKYRRVAVPSAWRYSIGKLPELQNAARARIKRRLT